MSALDDFKQGVRDDLDERVLPPPSAPMPVARIMVDDLYAHGDYMTLRHWRDDWWQWERSHWVARELDALRSVAYAYTEHAVRLDPTTGELVPWAPTRAKIANLLEATAAIVQLDERTPQPAWLDGRSDPGVVIGCTNGLLIVEGRRLLAHSPAFFNAIAVPFAYEPAASTPTEWLRFLDALWPDDPESIRTLQEWFGYVLSGRLDLQKILLLVGPTRGGKGTIARVLTALLGAPNVAGPTLSSLSGRFGLQPLLGKSLATVSDARLDGRNSSEVVERLLSISGEDSLSVERKHIGNWEGKLPARFMLLSNELPRLTDASAAIAGRFVPLMLTESWFGKEDHDLEPRLHHELAAIFNWALDGLDRLTAQRRFTMSETSQEAVEALAGLASPVRAFVGDLCVVGPKETVTLDDLWKVWKEWAKEDGHPPGNKQSLGRNLRSAVRGVKSHRVGSRDQQDLVYVGVGLNADGEDLLEEIKKREERSKP